MTPADLDWMLEKSRYTATFQPGGSFRETIAGPDPATSPNLRYATDSVTSPDGVTISRQVLIDERDANTFVHLEFVDV